MRTAIVTGGAQGIGLGIVEALLGQGYAVAIFERNGETLAQAMSELSGKFPDAKLLPFEVDVTDAAAVNAAIAETNSALGRIDVVVNNAGIVRDRRIVNMLDADWHEVIDANLTSQFLMCRAVAPIMIAQGEGRIVNLSSRAWLGGFGQVNYSAAKGGVVSLTRALALEFAAKGITVNAIAPGIIESPMTRSHPEEAQQKLRNSVPRKRVGQPYDIAKAVLFFADPENDYVTGQLLYVCGGRSLSSPSV